MVSRYVPCLTIKDKINTAMLEGSSVPAVIVEGRTDYFIYGRLLMRSKYRGQFDLVVGGSKPEILEYYENGLPFAHVVLLDADYDRYNKCCRNEFNIIYTHYYSVENYLVSESVVKSTMNDFASIIYLESSERKLLLEAIKSIKPLINVCYIKNDKLWPIKVEDIGIECWWDANSYCIDYCKLKQYIMCALLSKGITCKEYEYDQLLFEADDVVNKNGLIEFIVVGKHKLTAVYFQFCKRYHEYMNGRSKKQFVSDLCKNIFVSSEAICLIDELDYRLGIANMVHEMKKSNRKIS